MTGPRNPRMALEDRIWPRIEVGDCWLWTGGTDPKGYGSIKIAGSWVSTHRVVYQLLVGPIPEGLELDHLCRVPGCVNPDHLQPVDRRTNVLRGISFASSNAEKTHCLRGHPFDESNTYHRTTRGGRVCRKCSAASARRYQARKREAV